MCCPLLGVRAFNRSREMATVLGSQAAPAKSVNAVT